MSMCGPIGPLSTQKVRVSEMCRSAISSNHYSFDLQVSDVMAYFEHTDPNTYALLVGEFPEYPSLVWGGSWVDTAASGVDHEYMAWLSDAIEDMTSVCWDDGEPYAEDSECGNDHLMVCSDCLIVAVNHDDSGIQDPDRGRAVWAGIARYEHESGHHLTLGDDSRYEEFSRDSCDLCGDWHHGSRHEMVGI